MSFRRWLVISGWLARRCSNSFIFQRNTTSSSIALSASITKRSSASSLLAHFATSAVTLFSSLPGRDRLSRPCYENSRGVAMPEPDVVGSSSLSIAEILAKLGTDAKTGLNLALILVAIRYEEAEERQNLT